MALLANLSKSCMGALAADQESDMADWDDSKPLEGSRMHVVASFVVRCCAAIPEGLRGGLCGPVLLEPVYVLAGSPERAQVGYLKIDSLPPFSPHPSQSWSNCKGRFEALDCVAHRHWTLTRKP